MDLITDQAVAAHEQALASPEEGFEEILARVDDALARRDDRGVRVAASSATVDGVLDDDDVETLRERLRKDPGLDDLLDRFWPSVEPEAELCRILGVDGFSAADLPLLDALRHLLGSPQDAPEDATVGHVVVDEGQELSPMQWLMLVRRCPTRSFTIVGDIDQATSPHPHTAWADVVGPAFGDRFELRHLTICYRTPTEVMALAGPVLEAAGSPNQPPRAVRSTGIVPWSRPLSAGQVREALDQLRERYAGGAVGVVASTEWVRRLRRDGVDALTPAEAKGLEFDATLLIDPDGIAGDPRGWNALYVALTRCTQELGILDLGGWCFSPRGGPGCW